MTNNTPRFTRAPNLEIHETEDGLIVFDSATDRVHHLNHTAGALFEVCQQTHDSDELARRIAELYALDETPTDAIVTGLQQLVKEGVLIETRDD